MQLTFLRKKFADSPRGNLSLGMTVTALQDTFITSIIEFLKLLGLTFLPVLGTNVLYGLRINVFAIVDRKIAITLCKRSLLAQRKHPSLLSSKTNATYINCNLETNIQAQNTTLPHPHINFTHISETNILHILTRSSSLKGAKRSATPTFLKVLVHTLPHPWSHALHHRGTFPRGVYESVGESRSGKDIYFPVMSCFIRLTRAIDCLKREATKRNATKRNATKRNATKRNATKRNAIKGNATKRNATKGNATKRDAGGPPKSHGDVFLDFQVARQTDLLSGPLGATMPKLVLVSHFTQFM